MQKSEKKRKKELTQQEVDRLLKQSEEENWSMKKLAEKSKERGEELGLRKKVEV